MAPTAEFDALMGELDYTMVIVTVRDGETRAGCLVGFACQASIHPSRFLACLSDKNRTYRVAARGAGHLAVHFVPAGALGLAELFGGRTGDEVDKFALAAWHDGPRGQPILDDCPSWFVGRVVERHVFGDHVGFLLEPVVVHHEPAQEGLSFHRARRIDAGHEA